MTPDVRPDLLLIWKYLGVLHLRDRVFHRAEHPISDDPKWDVRFARKRDDLMDANCRQNLMLVALNEDGLKLVALNEDDLKLVALNEDGLKLVALNEDDLKLVDRFSLNYFVDATSWMTDGPMMAFHLKKPLMLKDVGTRADQKMVATKDVMPRL